MNQKQENPAEEQKLTGEAQQIAEEIRRSLSHIKNSQSARIFAEEEEDTKKATTVQKTLEITETMETGAHVSKKTAEGGLFTFLQRFFQGKRAAQSGKSQNKRNNKQRLTIVAAVLVWCALAVGSYGFLWHKLNVERTALYDMMETEIRHVQESNTSALNEMTAKIQTISEDIDTIKESMANTGAAIDSSSATNREVMAEKIAELDKQLASLQQSLKILQEDKNAR
ncbi:hypothetical protein SDC9_157593 [bioreactor metagenome]|uniref:Uncharacterized protein n=1 Tax=bioreactor metagenome TaxID=1076179 RepID=A0A645F7F2_9ZZZZ